MLKSAARNVCKQPINRFIGFNPQFAFAQQWLFIYVDLMKGGLMSFYSFLKVAVELFALNYYEPLGLKVADIRLQPSKLKAVD